MMSAHRIWIVLVVGMIAVDPARAEDSKERQPESRRRKISTDPSAADRPKPTGPQMGAWVYIYQIHSSDAQLPIPATYVATLDDTTGPTRQRQEDPVLVLVDPTTHPMNFGVILPEMGRTTTIGGTPFELKQTWGIPRLPQVPTDKQNPEWTRLASYVWLTHGGEEKRTTLRKETPTSEQQPDDGLAVSTQAREGLDFAILPVQANENAVAVQFKLMIARTYLTPANLVELSEFSPSLIVRNDFNIEMSLVLPHNRCAVIKIPSPQEDHPIFAFVRVWVLTDDDIYRQAAPLATPPRPGEE